MYGSTVIPPEVSKTQQLCGRHRGIRCALRQRLRELSLGGSTMV